MTDNPARGSALSIPGDYQYKALHHGPALQRFWHRNKRTLIDEVLRLKPGEVVVDVGCGSGNQSMAAADAGALVVGLDPSAAAVAFASSLGRARTAFAAALGGELPLASDSVDAAMFIEVIEHLATPWPVLHEIHRVLRPGGRVLVTTPNYGWPSPWPALEWLADRSGVTAEMAEHQHVARYDRARLAATLDQAGLRVTDAGTLYLLSPLAALLPATWADGLVRREIGRRPAGGAIAWCVGTK